MAESTIWASSLGKEWRGVNAQVQVADKLAWMFAKIQPKWPDGGGKPMYMLATNDNVKYLLTPQNPNGAWYWTKRSIFEYNQEVQGLGEGDQVNDPNDELSGQCNVEMGRLVYPIEIEMLWTGANGLGKLQEGGTMLTDRLSTADMIMSARIGSALRYGKKFPIAYVRVSTSSSTTVPVFWTGELRAAKKIKVDTIDPSTGTARATGGDSNTVNAINFKTHTLTMASATTFTAGDYIVPEDSYNKGFYGLADYLSDGSPIGDATVGHYYIAPGTTTWGGLTRSTYGDDYSTLILRNGTEGTMAEGGTAGALRDWGHEEMDELFTLRAEMFGDDGHPINVLWVTPDTYSYMWKYRKERFYGIEHVQQLTKDVADNYEFGHKAKAVYYHPMLADGGATVVVDDRAWPHCVVGLAMYNDDSDVIGTRWSMPPRWIPIKNIADKSIENYFECLINSTKYAKYRGTMMTIMGMVGNKPNAHCILADVYGARNEHWNRPSP